MHDPLLPRRSGFCRRANAVAAVVLLWAAAAAAQGRTDVVTLANGDRITGEVVRLDRGQLELKTDDIGTLYLEWDNVLAVVANRLVEVTTYDGRVFLGTLQRTTDRSIAVVNGPDTVQLTTGEVTLMSQIGRSFWRKLDGSIDAGFSYTKSSEVAQFNFNSDTVFRAPRHQVRIIASFTQTSKGEGTGNDDRGTLEATYLRYLGQRWFVTGLGRLEANESLGLELRSQAGGASGIRVINSNRAQMGIGGGLVINHEQGVDVEPTDNLEALATLRYSYFTYDRPRTNLDLTAQYYVGLNTSGQRVQFDASARREVLKDLFLALSIYDTFDSRPPNPDAATNDVGVVMSIGWSY